jgi:hypothetical protein
MPEFTVTEMTPQPFAYVMRHAKIADMSQVMGECFGVLGAALAKARAEPAGPPLSHYLDYDKDSSTFQVGFPIRPEDVEPARAAGLAIGETPSGSVMQGKHMGPYDTLHLTYAAMTSAMSAQDLEGTHDMWERYLSPPETPPEKTETEVMWPVKLAA